MLSAIQRAMSGMSTGCSTSTQKPQKEQLVMSDYVASHISSRRCWL